MLSAIVTLRDVVPLVPLAGLSTGVAAAEDPLFCEKFVLPLTPHPLIKASIRLKARKLQRFETSETGRLEARAPEAVKAQMIIFRHLDNSRRHAVISRGAGFKDGLASPIEGPFGRAVRCFIPATRFLVPFDYKQLQRYNGGGPKTAA